MCSTAVWPWQLPSQSPTPLSLREIACRLQGHEAPKSNGVGSGSGGNAVHAAVSSIKRDVAETVSAVQSMRFNRDRTAQYTMSVSDVALPHASTALTVGGGDSDQAALSSSLDQCCHGPA